MEMYDGDLCSRATYDDHLFQRTRRAKSRMPVNVQAPTRRLLDQFMAQPKVACHVKLPDLCWMNSTRCALRRMIDLHHYPVTLHSNKATLTVHLNKNWTVEI